MNTILVTGSNGQLGSEIKALAPKYDNYTFIFTDVEELDICNPIEVANFIDANSIDIIINCAAYTAVDRAEAQIELADAINHLAIKNMATIAKEKGIQLVHISTDYVFDGSNHRPYLETDTPNPQSVYGETKLAGEQAMQQINPINSVIIRTSWVYSNYGNNFVNTMLRLAKERDEINVVSDQLGTPTNAADLAQAILTILPKLNNEAVELFHYSNAGACSWYDFAKAIFQMKGVTIKVNPIESSQYPTAAERPFYSVLNKGNITKRYKVRIPYWRDSLLVCIKNIK